MHSPAGNDTVARRVWSPYLRWTPRQARLAHTIRDCSPKYLVLDKEQAGDHHTHFGSILSFTWHSIVSTNLALADFCTVSMASSGASCVSRLGSRAAWACLRLVSFEVCSTDDKFSILLMTQQHTCSIVRKVLFDSRDVALMDVKVLTVQRRYQTCRTI